MRAAVNNAKGKLAKLTGSPTNEQLALALTGAQFVATLGVWDKDDETTGKKIPGGNWLMSAKPKTAEVSPGPAPKASPKSRGFAEDDLDDDVPW